MYMLDGFMKESGGEVADLELYIESEPYDEEYVKTCIDSIVRSFMKHFGLKTKFEFLSAAESYRFEVMTNDYMSDENRKELIEEIDYIVGAVLYYEAQKAS